MKLDIRSHTDSRGSFKYNEYQTEEHNQLSLVMKTKWIKALTAKDMENH
jgi:hypothetical protein